MERRMIKFKYDEPVDPGQPIAYITDDMILVIKGKNSKNIYINADGFVGEMMIWRPFNDNVIKVFYRGDELKLKFE